MSKGGFSAADLQRGMKMLNSAPERVESKAESKSGSEFEKETLRSLEELYEKYEGDLDLM
jgi:hypothetical protein